jgi:pyruvate dehydrogenase phosphatase
VTQYPANNPCEDTYNVKQIMVNGHKHGYYAAVFDGHGGWQLAEYAKKNLHVYVEQELQKALQDNQPPTDAIYCHAIEAAFDRLEAEFLVFSKEAFAKGFPSAAYVGACALVALVCGSKLYVASAGDCRAGESVF